MRGASAERSVVASAFVEGERGPAGLVVGGSLGQTGPLQAGGDLGTQPYTGHGDRALSLRGTVRLGARHRLGVAFHTSALVDAPRPDLSTADDLRVFRLQQRDLAYLGWRFTGAAVSVSARAGAMVRTELRDRIRGARLDVERDRVVTALASVQVEGRYRGARLVAGVEASVDEVASGTTTTRDGVATPARGRYIDGSRYLQGGAWVLYQQRFGTRVLGEAGFRLALTQVAAPADGATPAMDLARLAPVGALGVRVLVAEGVAVLANLLTGFRMPNLDDFQALGAGARAFDVPNANLGAERAWSAELGLRLQRDGWTASAFVFGSLLTGLVVRVPSNYLGATVFDGRRVFTRENASEGRMWGAECDLAWRHRTGIQVALAAMVAQGDARYPGEAGNPVEEPMAKVPPAMGRATLGWRNARGWVDLVFTAGLPQPRLAASDREDPRLCPMGAAGCTAAPGWSSLTVRGGYALGERVIVGAAVENVWDAAYTPYGAGFPAPGINLVGMLRLRAR